MKKLILGAAFAVLAAACGGGGKPQLLDAAIDGQFACDPVAKTGCKTGEKCTWIVDIDGTMTTNEVGHIGCAAVGTATADGAACTDAVAATNGGADTCIAGDLCISRKCKPICDPQSVAGAAAGACTTNFACTLYAGVFDSAGPPVAGVCEPTCDPLTQQLKVGTTGTDACGSADPTKPSSACVFGPDPATWVCAPTDSQLYPNTDRKPPLTDPSSGQPYPNGCAPGFVPFFFEDLSGAMKTLCTGLCAPLKTDSTIVAMQGHAKDNQGDATALAKLTTDATPKAGNAICTPAKKGATDVASSFGEDCRFSWQPLFGRNPANAQPSPYNDTLGFCFAYEKFLAVMVTGNPQPQPEKSCAQLLPPAMADPNDPFGDAVSEGCYPLSQSQAAVRRGSRGALSRVRLGNGVGPGMRHILD